MYNLEFLPSAREDMVEIVGYISKELHNPAAAERLAGLLVEAAERAAQFPYANPAYFPVRPLKREYRKIAVENYPMFYWVDEEKKQITLAHVTYGRRDYQGRLE